MPACRNFLMWVFKILVLTLLEENNQAITTYFVFKDLHMFIGMIEKSNSHENGKQRDKKSSMPIMVFSKSLFLPKTALGGQ